MCDCHFLGKNSYFVKSFLFFMIFLFIPIFFFRDSFPFVLGREQFHSFFLTRKSVCVLKEIRNKKLTFFLLLCWIFFFFRYCKFVLGESVLIFFSWWMITSWSKIFRLELLSVVKCGSRHFLNLFFFSSCLLGDWIYALFFWKSQGFL